MLDLNADPAAEPYELGVCCAQPLRPPSDIAAKLEGAPRGSRLITAQSLGVTWTAEDRLPSILTIMMELSLEPVSVAGEAQQRRDPGVVRRCRRTPQAMGSSDIALHLARLLDQRRRRIRALSAAPAQLIDGAYAALALLNPILAAIR